MAVIQPSKELGLDNVVTFLWETVTNADTCAPITLSGAGALMARSHITGTPDSASVAVHASEHSTDGFAALADTQGTTVAMTTEGAAAELSTAARYIKPVPSGGGVSQDLDIRLTVRF